MPVLSSCRSGSLPYEAVTHALVARGLAHCWSGAKSLHPFSNGGALCDLPAKGLASPSTPMWVHKALSLTQPWPCCSWSQLGQAVPRAASLAASSVPLACRALPERWLGICLRLPGHSCLCCSPGLAGWGLHLKDTGAGGGGHAWAWHWAWLLTGLSINLLLVQPHPPFLGGAGAGAVVLDSLSPPALGPLGEG